MNLLDLDEKLNNKLLKEAKILTISNKVYSINDYSKIEEPYLISLFNNKLTMPLKKSKIKKINNIYWVIPKKDNSTTRIISEKVNLLGANIYKNKIYIGNNDFYLIQKIKVYNEIPKYNSILFLMYNKKLKFKLKYYTHKNYDTKNNLVNIFKLNSKGKNFYNNFYLNIIINGELVYNKNFTVLNNLYSKNNYYKEPNFVTYN